MNVLLILKRLAGIGLLVAALLPSAAIVWQARDMPHLGAVHDDQYYWITAKSLAQGSGYRTVSSPGSPYHTYYPPLYPALLSFVWRLDPSFPHNLPLASLLNWCFLPLLAVVSWHYFRESGLGRLALLSTALMMVLPIVVISATRLMTELLYCTLLLLALITLERAAQARGIGITVLAGLLANAVYLTRSAGLVLVIAGVLGLVIVYRKYLRAALFAVISMPSILAWTWWVRSHSHAGFLGTSGSFSNYADVLLAGLDLHGHLLAAWKNAVVLSKVAAGIFVFSAPDWLCYGLDIAIVAGAIALFRGKRARISVVFGILHVAALIAWPFPPDQRLAMPLLPMMLAGMLILARSAVRRIGAPASNKSDGAAVAASLLYFVFLGGCAVWGTVSDYVLVWRVLPRFIEDERQQAACDGLANQWIKANTPATAGFVSNRPAVIYLYTGHVGGAPDLPTSDWYRSEEYRAEDALRSIPEYMRANMLSYVLIRDGDWTSLSKERRAALEEWLGKARLVRQASPCPSSVIYQLAGN